MNKNLPSRGYAVITISIDKKAAVENLDSLYHVFMQHMNKSSAVMLIARLADTLGNGSDLNSDNHEHIWFEDYDGFIDIHFDSHALKAHTKFIATFVPFVNVLVSAAETLRSFLLVIDHKAAWGRLSAVIDQPRKVD